MARSMLNDDEININELCPCSVHKSKRKRRRYGDCCKKRHEQIWRRDSKTGELYKSIIITDPDAVNNAIKYRKMKQKERGRKKLTGPYFTHSNGRPMTVEDFKSGKISLFMPLLHLRICDPCYFYCITEGVDFYPNEWKYILDKQERMIRKKEWNDSIEIYIKHRKQSKHHEIRNDVRKRNKIRKLHRIGRYGTLERQLCLNCNKREKYESEFKICKQCEIGKYCSRKCQKRHWFKHKIECQTNKVKHQMIPAAVITLEYIKKS